MESRNSVRFTLWLSPYGSHWGHKIADFVGFFFAFISFIIAFRAFECIRRS